MAAAALGCRAAAGRRLRAPGRFRCAEILEGRGDREAQSLKHHVPRGPRLLSVLGKEAGNRPLSWRLLYEQRGTRSAPPFCNSNLPPRNQFEKKREERNARVQLLRKRAGAWLRGTISRGQWGVTPRMRPAARKNRRRDLRPRLAHARAGLSQSSQAPVTCRPQFAFEAFARGWLRRGAREHGHSVSVSEALAVACGVLRDRGETGCVRSGKRECSRDSVTSGARRRHRVPEGPAVIARDVPGG